MAMYGVPPGVRELPPQVFGAEAGGQPPAAEEVPVHRARGTMILVLVFLAAFIVYYFVNWKLLSIVWKIG